MCVKTSGATVSEVSQILSFKWAVTSSSLLVSLYIK